MNVKDPHATIPPDSMSARSYVQRIRSYAQTPDPEVYYYYSKDPSPITSYTGCCYRASTST